MRALLLAGVTALLGCSTDPFLTAGDASASDSAGDVGVGSDGAGSDGPTSEAGGADAAGMCPHTETAGECSGCGFPSICCVTDASATCTTQALCSGGGDLACLTDADCGNSTGTPVCCARGAAQPVACPVKLDTMEGTACTTATACAMTANGLVGYRTCSADTDCADHCVQAQIGPVSLGVCR